MTKIEQMPQEPKVINLKNDKIIIRTGIYFKKSKKFKNAYTSSIKEYSLFANRERHPARGEMSNIYYTCKVKYYANINGEKQYFVNYLNLRDFSRIQANQKENLPLPILIQGNKAYIDFDALPII